MKKHLLIILTSAILLTACGNEKKKLEAERIEQERIEAIRNDITYGIQYATASRTAVTEHYYVNGLWGANNEELGLPDANQINSNSVKSIAVNENIITITYQGGEEINDKILTYVRDRDLSLDNLKSAWTCTTGEGDQAIDALYLPDNCK